jgi:hypothetical protein
VATHRETATELQAKRDELAEMRITLDQHAQIVSMIHNLSGNPARSASVGSGAAINRLKSPMKHP